MNTMQNECTLQLEMMQQPDHAHVATCRTLLAKETLSSLMPVLEIKPHFLNVQHCC
jgi:hypothetical protein